jgi:hypothetical protein
VRRKYGKEYTVGVAIVDKIHREVTAVAVKYKETPVPLPPRFLLRSMLEYLFKPRQTNVIIRPSTRCGAHKHVVLFGFNPVHP